MDKYALNTDEEHTMDENGVHTDTDVVIVGGGLAGLAAACYLARGGASVRLYEKAARPGGRAATTVFEGYHLNLGAHALYSGGATEEVLRELGIAYVSHRPTDISVLREDRLYQFPDSISNLLRTKLLDLRDKLELGRIFAQLTGLKPASLARMSVSDWIAARARRPRVQQFLRMFACTNVYSAALDQVSAEVLIHKLQLSLKHPILYLDGGWQVLVDGLRQAAEQAGAQISTGVRVEAVEQRGRRVQGVRLANGHYVAARAVLIATTPREAIKLLDAVSAAPLGSYLATMLPAEIACLDVALRSLPDHAHPVVQDLEGPRFLTAQSRYAQIAPAGGAVIHTFKQLDPHHPSDPREDERELEGLLNRVQPGWRELLVRRVFLPRMDGVSMLPTTNIGGYAGRPKVQATGIERLLLAGDWIGEGFLADASMNSARQAAQLLLQQLSSRHIARAEAVLQ
ncbi:dehydrogenase [Dictyobacter alpinus]|uniref:Dehydrogenase n=1 Tax=Dictyobacter alpinus TaxID=2014873 RepID=A0A402BC84_9CHLR|nr:FAD-dependent oxidoreductase [Dictyobacter alpinus]GCE28887.1 dehydrogenase [Dictyobacter alpinus]